MARSGRDWSRVSLWETLLAETIGLDRGLGRSRQEWVGLVKCLWESVGLVEMVYRSRRAWSRLSMGVRQNWSVKISHEHLWKPAGLVKSVCKSKQEREFLHEPVRLVKNF